jgi:translation initiation factor 2 subunit 1
MDIFGDVYGAFETASEEGAESLTEEGIPQD